MCHVVFLSTTSSEDLSTVGDGLFTLRRVESDEREEIASTLQHPHRWYLEGRYGGCSCHFRHTEEVLERRGESCVSVDPHFGEPEDWSPEDADDIESTAAFYDLLVRLAAAGERVDVVAAWNGTEADEVSELEVRLSTVPRSAFRFFDAYRFEVLA